MDLSQGFQPNSWGLGCWLDPDVGILWKINSLNSLIFSLKWETDTQKNWAILQLQFLNDKIPVTLCCISLGRCCLGLEIRVIIKISTHPCYPINDDWFSLGWMGWSKKKFKMADSKHCEFNKSRQSWRRQIYIKYVLGCSSYLPNQNNTLWNFYLQKSWTNFVQYIEDVTNIMICSENWPSFTTPFKNPNRLLGKIPSQFCF